MNRKGERVRRYMQNVLSWDAVEKRKFNVAHAAECMARTCRISQAAALAICNDWRNEVFYWDMQGVAAEETLNALPRPKADFVEHHLEVHNG